MTRRALWAMAATTVMALATLHAGAVASAPLQLPFPQHAFPVRDPAAPASGLPIHVGLPGDVRASGGNLIWHGGDVQHNPKIYIVFWGWHGSDPAHEAPYLQNFTNGTGGSNWGAVQTQYNDSVGYVTNPTGQLHGVWWDDTNPNAPDPDLGQPGSGLGILHEAIAAAGHFGYDADADYVIATPTGHSTSGFGSTFCAWHSWAFVTSGVPGVGVNVAFTNLPYMPDAAGTCGKNFVNSGSAGNLDGVSIVAGHEYAETITDPHLDAWYDSAGAEDGDKCAWNAGPGAHAQNVVLSSGTFAVQSLWSNAKSDCEVTYP